jgi:hypothetical protein
MGPPAAVARITLTPTTSAVVKGSRLPLSFSALDSAGNVVNDVKASWASSAPLVANIADDGTIAALDSGAALITVRVGDYSAYADVVVTSVPTIRMYSVLDLGPDANIHDAVMRQLSDSGDVLAGKVYRGAGATSIPGCSTPVAIDGPGHVLCKVNPYDSVSSYAVWRNGGLAPLAVTDTFTAQHFRAFAMNDSDEVAGRPAASTTRMS